MKHPSMVLRYSALAGVPELSLRRACDAMVPSGTPDYGGFASAPCGWRPQWG